ncbi:MAG TPA: energy transducer TonB [Brevundimonas sp.]|jgi:hypothetical protein|uniref:energy transducer TonB n=1 Tax=Brevundimonas sp. TaxID=1871086 RepID=UPI002E123DAE|nr:energy transducer TonB [Brevundimonas sp.]
MIRSERARLGLAAVGLGLMLVAPAAQAQDWNALDLGRDISAVAVQWDSGAALAVQCRSDGLFAMLRLVHPVPPSADVSSPTVPVTYDHGGRERRQSWMLNTDGGAAFAPTPERFARRLLAGGDLELLVEPGEGPRQRYPLSLPADPTPLAAVLRACDVPLEHPLDDPPQSVTMNVPVDGATPDLPQLEWVRRPTGQDLADEYPTRALERGQGGRAIISCLVRADGRLEDCQTISEYPRGAGFGRATIRVSERGFQMGGAGGAPLPERAHGARVEIPMTWNFTRVQ